MAIEQTKTGSIRITGEHIEWYRLISMLLALRMELLGMTMTRGTKASVLLKKEIGLPKSHPNRMVFMYANNVMYAKNLISESTWKSNISYLQKRFRD